MPERAWLAELHLHSTAEEVTALLAALLPTFERRFQAVAAELHLTRPQAQLLAQLPPERPLSQREVSLRLHCAPSRVVGLTDQLELRGWLTRRVAAADRRVNTLVLTAEGCAARERLLRRLVEPPKAIRRLPRQAQQALRDVLRAVVEELENQ